MTIKAQIFIINPQNKFIPKGDIMIESIKLKFGGFTGEAPLNVPCVPLTIFVGPNNAGKSLALQEINMFCRQGHKNPNQLILDDISFSTCDEEKAKEKIKAISVNLKNNEACIGDTVTIASFTNKSEINREELLQLIKNPHYNLTAFCRLYVDKTILILDGKQRIELIKEKNMGDLTKEITNCFQALFLDDKKRKEIRRILYEAFNKYFVIDPTNGGKLRIRLSEEEPTEVEKTLTNEALEFHKRAILIDETSDGVKAFTGLLTEIIAGDPNILLIDEPEAFLHPNLAHKLGKEIAQAINDSEKRLFVATHSSDFIMGCVHAGTPLNIVRLTNHKNPTARILPYQEILKLMRNPLLRSTGILKGLFYEFVIVTESDTDRAFYQEINERLLHFKSEWGIPNCLFVNAQNKQTIPAIIKPLRALGIPAVGIVDIDIVKGGGKEWTRLLDAIYVPQGSQKPLETGRHVIKSIFDKFDPTDKELKKIKRNGITLLSSDNQSAANDFFDHLDNYGLFTVRYGEIESWLADLDLNKSKPNWLVAIFEKMGEDPNSKDYIRPNDGDVWKFIGDLKKWLTNPNRKGIPDK